MWVRGRHGVEPLFSALLDAKASKSIGKKIFTPPYPSVRLAFPSKGKKAPGRDERRETMMCSITHSTYSIPAGGFLFLAKKKQNA